MASTEKVLGSIVSLWRYPVKSMMGEEVNAAEVTERGLLGDRAYALVDSSNEKVASAKNPRKWAALFDCRVTFIKPPQPGEGIPPIRITLPDGTLVTSEDRELARLLSQVIGRDVTLARQAPPKPSLEEYWPDIEGLAQRDTVTDESMPSGTFFDGATVHVLTTATIDRLRELYPQGRFEVRRFRPNIVVKTAAGKRGFIENGWVGQTLAIGDEVQLKITAPCPRCVMTTLPQGDLPSDPGILRAAAQHNQANVGVYAAVLRGGMIRRGAEVRAE